MRNLKFSIQTITVIGLTILAQLSLVDQSYAAPLQSPLSSAKLTLAEVTFPTTGWTLSPITNRHALNKFNGFVSSSYDWTVIPSNCMPPRDAGSLRIARDAIRKAAIELFTQKNQHKDIFVALTPNTPGIKGFVPRIKNTFDTCSDASAHTRALLEINQSKAHAIITPITPPHINGVVESYGYRLNGTYRLPASTNAAANPLGTETGEKALNREGAGIVYLALVRDVWILMLEGGTYGNTEELAATFEKQISKIEHLP